LFKMVVQQVKCMIIIVAFVLPPCVLQLRLL
jgi:hypothetical protein